MRGDSAVEQILKRSIFTGQGRHHIHRMYHTAESGWAVYAQSYKEAADHLVNEMDSGDEIEVYALMFLYRHSLELKIKHRVARMSQHLGDESVRFGEGHNLEKIWGEFRRLWDVLAEDSSDDSDVQGPFADISDRVAEFVRLDKFSTELRYPVQKDGSPTMGGLLKGGAVAVVDVYQLGLVVDAIFAVLDGAGDWLEARRTG